MPSGYIGIGERVIMARRSKYAAIKIRTEDGVFDSKREYAVWCDLKIKQRAGRAPSGQAVSAIPPL